MPYFSIMNCQMPFNIFDMKITYSRTVNAKPDILLCPVFEGKTVNKKINSKIRQYLKQLLENNIFQGKSGEKEIIYSQKNGMPKYILFVGMGKKQKADEAQMRSAFAGAMKSRMKESINTVGIHIYSDFEKYANLLAEAVLLVNYEPSKYKTGKEAKKLIKKLFSNIIIYSDSVKKDMKDGIEKVQIMTEAVHLTRDLVNGPANIMTIAKFAEEAKNIAKDTGCSLTVLDEKKIKKMGMGAFLGVNSGSGKREARMVILDYKPKKVRKKDKKDPLIIAGKGMVFDSGGYNLKPSKHIEDMQQDKAGGAVVLGLFKALKALKVRRRIIGIVPLAENLIDADAQRPSDIITSYSGKTIEIRNTDAEGRMILADGMSYGVEKYNPEYLIDIATLTGSCIVALGDRYAGVMGNDKTLVKKLIESSNRTDELLWELPLHKDFTEDMKGKFADLRNIDDSSSHLAGASKAAAFLQNFAGKTKWAHIDIAGTAFTKKPKAHEREFATGFGVRLLADLLENI